MAIITTDIIINGKHATIARALIDNGLFQNGAEVFVEAALLGVYLGYKSEVDNSTPDKVEISRTYLQNKNRLQLENVLFIFLQHEKLYQKRSLSAAEVFNINENTVELKSLVEDLKSHALFGIEELGRRYSELMDIVNMDSAIDEVLEKRILPKQSIIDKVNEDDATFCKSYQDDEIEAIINGLEGGKK